MPALYSPKAVANHFLGLRHERKRGPVTQMKLHKLVYFAHGWHLGIKETPLLDEMVEAWDYGPVVPTLYYEFKAFGADPINRLAADFNHLTHAYDIVPQVHSSDTFVLELLDRVWEVYGVMSAGQLSALTHRTGSPWTATRNEHPGIRRVDIPNRLIQQYFANKVKENQGGG